MASLMIGEIKEYKPSEELWTNYKKRLEFWMKCNKIEEENKLNVFLSVVGPDTFDLVSALVAPVEVEDSTYEDLVGALDQYYKPPERGMAKRVLFRGRKQREGESVSDYIVELKKISRDCEFTPAELLPNLRDTFTSGLKSKSIQQKLFEIGLDKLTWERAQTVALNMESAYNDSGRMHDKTSFNKGTLNRVSNAVNVKPNFVHSKSKTVCGRCTGNHKASDCPYIHRKCYNCGKIGHIVHGCRQPKYNKSPSTQYDNFRSKFKSKPSRKSYGSANCVEEKIESLNIDGEMGNLFGVKQDDGMCSNTRNLDVVHPEIKVEMSILGENVKFTVDTAASVTVIPEDLYYETFPDVSMVKSNALLRGYSGSVIPVVGEIFVDVIYCGKKYSDMRIIVVQGSKQPLLGREWLKSIKLNWQKLFSVNENSVCDILEKFKSVFQPSSNRCITPFVANVKISENSSPVFCRPRPVAYAVKDSVDKELAKLVSTGVLVKVEKSEWASPIVVVPKKTPGVVRICGDYKVSVNRYIEDEPYPFPTTEDLYTKLTGGILFSKLDLSSAYLQLPLDQASKELLTINTHLGLFQYQKLPFGVSTAPAIFQKVMDKILCGLDRVCCKIDDILISATSESQHNELLDEVLRRLEMHGITLSREKCEFGVTKLEYLGHVIDKNGLHPTPSKVQAISNAKLPTNVSELRSFLGVVQYYSHFLPNLSTVLSPLYYLLGKDVEWNWTTECTIAVDSVKKFLTSDRLLVHYSNNKKLILACDASPVGIGAVISHVMDNGQERPIAYASRTLSKAEQNYSQIDREALGIVFGVRKFHKYLYGRPFVLITDHKPLTTLFSPKAGIPTLAAIRMQRWSLILAAYQYTIEYRKSSDHGNADMLSRLPLENVDSNICELEVNYFTYTNDLPVTALDISNETKKDPILCKIWRYVMHGWPENSDDVALEPYFRRKNELSVDNGCLLWGLRVIIPPKYREKLLTELHREHLGIVRMKSVARSYFWYPNMDIDIESLVSRCTACISVKKVANPAPIFSWKVPSKPWERVHIDFFELNGRNFLLLIDTYSKWLEIEEMKITSANKTLEVLGNWFARFGLPCEIVSDNGPQFSSYEYKQFMSNNGIKCTFSPPYHPSSNGAAERSVQTVKLSLKKHLEDSNSNLSVQKCLASFLFTYRNTPHTVTNRKPSELLLNCEVRTRFTLLRPNIQQKVVSKQNDEIEKRNVNRKIRQFVEGEKVRILNVRSNYPKWYYGRIVKCLSSVRYLVKIGYRERQVHVDHLMETFEENLPDEIETIPNSDVDLDLKTTNVKPSNQSKTVNFEDSRNIPDSNMSKDSEIPIENQNIIRRSERIRKPPDRLIVNM